MTPTDQNSKWIEEQIAAGYTIVCDRYCYSGMVYSAAKDNPSLPLQWARDPDVGLPRPDVVIFLDLSPEEAEKRGAYGEEKYEKKEMQRRVRELFLDLREGLRTIDAGKSIDEVAKEVLENVVYELRSAEGDELGRVEKWQPT